jgi:hypothetical protein
MKASRWIGAVMSKTDRRGHRQSRNQIFDPSREGSKNRQKVKCLAKLYRGLEIIEIKEIGRSKNAHDDCPDDLRNKL